MLISVSLIVSIFASAGSIGVVQATGSSYTPHSAIHIGGNGDLATLRSQGVCTGSGTANDPYVINGYEITGTNSSTCITVLNITVHLVISNCYLHGDLYGIMVEGSNDVTVTNSNCSGNYYHGIFLYFTGNDTLTNNVCIDGGHGIMLNASNDNTITNNSCNAARACAILLSNSSLRNVLSENTCYSSYDNGIYLRGNSDHNTIVNNTLKNNNGWGVKLAGVNDNLVYGNEFISNMWASSTYNASRIQGYDDGVNNIWNTASYGNYWSDWTTPDANGDGIIDSPYLINANNNSEDHYPLVLTVNISNTQVNGASVVLTGKASAYVSTKVNWSNEASGLSGQVTPTNSWTASIDLVAGSNKIVVTLSNGRSLMASDNVTVTGNDVLPTLTIVSPTNNSYGTSGLITLHWTIGNVGSGLAKTEISTNGTTWTTVNGSSQTLSLADGPYTVSVRATSNVGNVNQTSVSFIVDTVKPVIVIESPNRGSYSANNSVMVQWNASDAASGIAKTEISTDGTTWTTVTGNSDILTFSLGPHTVYVKVTDNAGNTNQTSASFTIDKTAPTITAKSPTGSNVSKGATISVLFSQAMDETATTITVNGVTGTMSWSGNNATFTPSSALAYNTDLFGHRERQGPYRESAHDHHLDLLHGEERWHHLRHAQGRRG